MSGRRPSATPQTSAWSGVSSHLRPAAPTASSSVAADANVALSVRRYAASWAFMTAPSRVREAMNAAMNQVARPPAAIPRPTPYTSPPSAWVSAATTTPIDDLERRQARATSSAR